MKTKEQIIADMCLTMRHDFGLNKEDTDGWCGMTNKERDFLKREMTQLYEHHIQPLVDENHNLWDDYFTDLCDELRGHGYEITEFPLDDYCLNTNNPHAKRIGRTIALMLNKLKDKDA